MATALHVLLFCGCVLTPGAAQKSIVDRLAKLEAVMDENTSLRSRLAHLEGVVDELRARVEEKASSSRRSPAVGESESESFDPTRRLTSSDEYVEIAYDGSKMSVSSSLHVSGDAVVNGTMVQRGAVAFQAYASAGALAASTTVAFDVTLLNKGGGYDDSAYTFTAPVSGLYYFAFHSRTGSTSDVAPRFMKNGVDTQLGQYVFSGAQNSGVAASMVMALDASDTVNIYNFGSSAMGSEGWGNYYAGFAGFLIAAL